MTSHNWVVDKRLGTQEKMDLDIDKLFGGKRKWKL